MQYGKLEFVTCLILYDAITKVPLCDPKILEFRVRDNINQRIREFNVCNRFFNAFHNIQMW